MRISTRQSQLCVSVSAGHLHPLGNGKPCQIAKMTSRVSGLGLGLVIAVSGHFIAMADSGVATITRGTYVRTNFFSSKNGAETNDLLWGLQNREKLRVKSAYGCMVKYKGLTLTHRNWIGSFAFLPE